MAEDIWEELRAAMPVTEKWAYFDHAAVAPLSGAGGAGAARVGGRLDG